MNPLLIAQNLRTDYLQLLRSTFRPRQQELREAFDREVEKPDFLIREPFISLAQPFRVAPALSELDVLTRQRFGAIAATPYQHQAEACRRIMAGKPTVVATGTGSGKTEAFLLPIIDHCIRARSGGAGDGVKAILIYPMNALATDQANRIREMLRGTNISFGRYTGETKFIGERRGDQPDNERVMRTEFRKQPPDLLLTNYMMLEYMLMRGDGRDIFKNHQVRFVVLDEVHTYHGVLGTDVACLMRRLRAALGRAAEASGGGRPATTPVYVGTSATLQAGGNEDPRVGVARFFTQLTGIEAIAESVITEEIDPPVMPAGLMLPRSPSITDADLVKFNAEDPAVVRQLLTKLFGNENVAAGQEARVWDGLAVPYLLMSWLRSPQPLEQIISQLGEQPERQGVATDDLRREVEAALLVGPCMEGSRVRLRPRVHRFLRGLARFWRCTNSACGKLLGEGIESCDACGCRSLPLALCRTCGWDFFVVRRPDKAGVVQPWLSRNSVKDRTTYLYDPPTEPIEVEADEDPEDEEEPSLFDGEDSGKTNGDEADDEGAISSDTVMLDPKFLIVGDADMMSTSGEYQARRVCRFDGRGTRCPVCKSRYGRYEVLTPVSLGNSSALTHIARVVMRDLPEDQRKLLVFCDSRQDAAHQARFIRESEELRRYRRVLFQALVAESDAHDWKWLIESSYKRLVSEGFYAETRKADEKKRRCNKIEGAMLRDFAIAPRVRQGLERLGLVRVVYSGLDAATEEPAFVDLCRSFNLDAARVARATRIVLDEMRQRMAINHEALRQPLKRGSELAERFDIKPNAFIGRPKVYAQPGVKSERKEACEILSTWSPRGGQAAIQAVWRQMLGDDVSQDSLHALLNWLADSRIHGHETFLATVRVGMKGQEVEGWQVNLETVLFESGKTFTRCSTCDRVQANEQPGSHCSRNGCSGQMQSWAGPIAERLLSAIMVAENFAPTLKPAEHSAAVSDDDRARFEEGFKSATAPDPNLLACTPTLEMGVNIGDLEAIAMRNIPPSPAHYAQRAGRSGRKSRMGITVGFSRSTPHDGYFFDNPAEIIAGAIPPPRFNLRNLEAIRRHVGSLVFEHAEAEFPQNLEPFVTEEGIILDEGLKPLCEKLTGATGAAIATATALWPDLGDAGATTFKQAAETLPNRVREALAQRASLIKKSKADHDKLGQKVTKTASEKRVYEGLGNLVHSLRSDNRYSYLPRVLAEAGILPGYSFPGDPGSVALGYDPEPVFTGRLQAQREFAPGQIVYARGMRWQVGGIAMDRPGAPRSSAGSLFNYALCPSCQLANNPQQNVCRRCKTKLGGDQGGDKDFVAWDAGAFQAFPAEMAADAEEERMQRVFDIRVHPQRDTKATRYAVGSWFLDLRQQEDLWVINHGLQERERLGELPTNEGAFMFCPQCGEHRSVHRHVEIAKKGAPRDPEASKDPHAKKCKGEFKPFALGHQMRSTTLRLVIPGIDTWGNEGEAVAWSLLYALMQGAVKAFDIDDGDLDCQVLTKQTRVEHEKPVRQVLDMLWTDRIIGGSGILPNMVENFPAVAAAAIKHLEGHECPSSCYRCLRFFRNQRVHGLLDWRLAKQFLLPLAHERVQLVGEIAAEEPVPEQSGPEWDEARAAGLESPQELRLFKAIVAAGGTLPKPSTQHKVFRPDGSLLTRADFAYLDCSPKLLIYVDGLAYHGDLRSRIHDQRVTNQLQTMGYRVLRFFGFETHHHPEECVERIRAARQLQGAV